MAKKAAKTVGKAIKNIKKTVVPAKRKQAAAAVEVKPEPKWNHPTVNPGEGLVVQIDVHGGELLGRHVDGSWRTIDGTPVGIKRWGYR